MADQNIALGVQVPDAMKSISGMLNFANQAQSLKSAQQAYKAGSADLKQKEYDLGEREAIQSLSQRLNEFSTESGEPDYAKLISEASRVAPKSGMDWVKNIASAHVESLNARRTLNTVSAEERAQAGQMFLGLADLPKDAQDSALADAKKKFPNLATAFDYLSSRVLPNAKTPEERRIVFVNASKTAMSPEMQKAMGTPSGVMVNDGQQQQLYNTNPMAGATGPVAGVQAQNQIPPTAETVNPATGAKEFVGPQGAGAWAGPEPIGAFRGDPKVIAENIRNNVPDPIERANALRALENQVGRPVGQRLQTSLAPGEQAGIEGTVATVNKDWDDLSNSAKTASQDIGVLQNIKKYADGAVTGVLSDRRALVTGIAGLLGMEPSELERTNTDLLAKNSNMLALAGGNTDAARTLAEAANPNVKMTPSAIKKAADQLIAQRQLALARQDFMRPFKALNNPSAYSAAMSEFNKIADPRVLQLQSMTPEEKAAMKGAMTEGEQKEFGNKIRRMQELGIVK
jgi:hypothetical protein